VSPKKIKAASTLQLTTAYCQVFDKVRLLEGKSTSNINNQSIIIMALDTIKNINERLAIAEVIPDVVLDATTQEP
jgi:hypothetical protein